MYNIHEQTYEFFQGSLINRQKLADKDLLETPKRTRESFDQKFLDMNFLTFKSGSKIKDVRKPFETNIFCFQCFIKRIVWFCLPESKFYITFNLEETEMLETHGRRLEFFSERNRKLYTVFNSINIFNNYNG